MTENEHDVLERFLRTSPSGIDRAQALLLLDHNHAAAFVALVEHAAEQRRRLAQYQQSGGWPESPCGITSIAAHHVLTAAPAARQFADLLTAFDPSLAATPWKGCSPRELPVSLAVFAWLIGDEPRAATYLVRARPEGIIDNLSSRVTSLLVRNRGAEVGDALHAAAPTYAAAMAAGLWRNDPYAFLHIKLLAVLLVGAERGALDLGALPDEIPYAPIQFLSYLRDTAHTASAPAR